MVSPTYFHETTVTRRRSLVFFVGSLVLLLALMSYQATDPTTGRSVLGSVVYRIFSPVQVGAAAAVRTIFQTAETYIDLTATNHENARLQKELGELRIQLAIAAQATAENQRLRRILELKDKVAYRLVVGEVTGTDAKPTLSATIAVNRGSRHGVRVPMPVVTPYGVVGITTMVEPFTSKVQSISDASASIGAMLEKSRIAGILSGMGGGRCVLRFLPLNSMFKTGDLVVTSGQDGIFPEGLPIGRVSKAIHEADSYRALEVSPFQNYSSLDEVVFLFYTPVSSDQPASDGNTPPPADQ